VTIQDAKGIATVVEHSTLIFDISVPVTPNLPVWPGDPPVGIRPVMRIAAGADCNVSELACSSHAGTHIDAPWHFIEAGARVDEIPLNLLIGPCLVVDLFATKGQIDAEQLAAAGIAAGTRRLLLRTRNSQLWADRPGEFVRDFAGLSLDAAQWLLDRDIQLVGIDYHSIEPFDADGDPVHRVLLGANVVVIENLDLSGVEPGSYQLVCLPLRLAGLDGAPARAVLIADA
jgi:arylformamidase